MLNNEMQSILRTTLVNFLIEEGYDNEEIESIFAIEDINNIELTSKHIEEFINGYRLD